MHWRVERRAECGPTTRDRTTRRDRTEMEISDAMARCRHARGTGRAERTDDRVQPERFSCCVCMNEYVCAGRPAESASRSVEKVGGQTRRPHTAHDAPLDGRVPERGERPAGRVLAGGAGRPAPCIEKEKVENALESMLES